MHNVISVDVEDYFHVEAFASHLSPTSWDSFAPRVEANVDRALELFARRDVSATFFILGWVADRFPAVVRRIAESGHEVGCHGFAHQHIRRQSPAEFREDIRRARGSLMDQARQPVHSYRAPSFSIVRETLWALGILAEEGIRFDSSIFPAHHDLYGIPEANRFPHWLPTTNRQAVFEFPPTTIRLAGRNWGAGGGGYLRFAPYGLTRWALRRINVQEQQPAMVYFHPWELDPDQPRIRTSLRSRLRHYTNLATMAGKVEQLLRDFQFTTLTEACRELEAYHTLPLVAECAPVGAA